jgi:hypothetical protein
MNTATAIVFLVISVWGGPPNVVNPIRVEQVQYIPMQNLHTCRANAGTIGSDYAKRLNLINKPGKQVRTECITTRQMRRR